MLKRFCMMKRYLFIFLIVNLLAGCSGGEPSNTTTKKEQDSTSIVSEKSGEWGNAPDFTARKVGGGEFELSSLKGKVILLHSWAVRCEPCKMQIPIFVELYKKYNSEGLEIVGFCLDPETAAKNYAKLMDMNYILISFKWEIVRKYPGMLSSPTTFLIDRQGNIVEKYEGYKPKSIIEKEIKKLIDSKEK